MIKANNQKGLAGRRLLIALAAFTLLPAGRADCLANSPGNAASDSASTLMQDQKKEISGAVLDSNGEPLVGVSVIEKGSMNGCHYRQPRPFQHYSEGRSRASVLIHWIH